MKLLILGGTIFVGRHLVEAARARGHELSLFNRGQHNAELFPDVEKLRGDRDGGLSALAGRRWDAVIDTSGYVPRLVRASAEALSEQVPHYVFISTISVYEDVATPHQDEDAPLKRLDDPTVEQVTGESYGGLKVLCEEVVRELYPEQHLIIRPGLIVGPHDPTFRFTYWPRRVAQGGAVLAPDSPDVPVQFIDARDLAEWTIRLVEQGATGTFNATGPDRALTMGALLATAKQVTGSDAEFTWVDEALLEEKEVGPFMEMPLWVPREAHGLSQISVERAVAAGLTFRPLDETIRDTLAWDETLPADLPRPAGLRPEREADILAAWHER